MTGWINTVKAERASLDAQLLNAPRADRISAQEITELLSRAGNLAQMIAVADPLDKAGLCQRLGLRMTYYPEKQLVEARVIPEPPHVRSVRVRGGT
ncbi:hypothetical protein ACRYCC_32695 [Actinomadura scrupuli]|uniref:hypothetical protein n=1 Tax=Actinomadura scrupuli TaxID=559629 RepID=UPI003D98662C